MLFTKYIILLVAGFASYSLAATFASVADAFTSLDATTDSIENIAGRIARSPGGMTELLSIAGSINTICGEVHKCQENLKGMQNFTKKEEEEGNPH
ncbi:uncharacterized protein GIQ15_01287 [Arthroderma uncinatum]|uniref:uncharacterized protein n=1 Tax=Arthroderma uncinatum TaxID=74035 RepID=UPI00144A8044|nr:uncharacterized protein GIQ15_01287 [Arthroderma uncinatum]KAF3491770.1 hypothetical protein GIQ15_01287 [Arthroderma uncinatum]